MCLVKRFVCFYYFRGFEGMLLPVLSAGSPLFLRGRLFDVGGAINFVLRRQ